MPATSLSPKDLFDPEFLASLAQLRILAGRVARGGRHAEQRSKDLGSGIEFRDFRPYSPGDDFRAIDWNIYRRLGRVFLKLFEEFEDLPVYLLPDCSLSLFLEEPPRIKAGLRTALALASIALNQHDSVGIFPFGESLTTALRPQAGKGRLMRVAERLSAVEPQGSTDFASSFRTFNAMKLREGLVVVISDFFDPGGIEAVTKALKTLRHRLLLVQLVRKSDARPELQGDLQLIDCETGAAEDVSATAAVLQAYAESYRRFETGLTKFAKSRQIGLLQLDVEQAVLPQLATLFESGSYRP
ncbi:MAG: DUF58 domain-containing protein [Planctomycetota bacterium]